MSSARSIAGLKVDRTGTIKIEDTEFEYTIYPNPHKRSDAEQESLAELFGNRFQNGKPCLDITEEFVLKNIKNNTYSALIFVKNKSHDDSATCSLQYYNWCNPGSTKDRAIWINDLCRVNNSGKRLTSPVYVLFKIVEDFSKERGVYENYLLVEDKKNSTTKLLEIYGGYKFTKNNACKVKGGYIAMKKTLQK